MTEKKWSKPKRSAAHETKKFPRKDVQVLLDKGDTEEVTARKTTAVMTSPEMAALRVMRGAERKSGYWESVDVPALIDQLRGQAETINNGDLRQTEAMLMNQATALQSLFARLAERAMSCDHIPGFEANMRMALRAQSQCRVTLETLANIKNPPFVYAKQANISAGHQQVNNGLPSRTREVENMQNQLLEKTDGEWMDTRTKGSAGGTDQAMAALGNIDGSENG